MKNILAIIVTITLLAPSMVFASQEVAKTIVIHQKAIEASETKSALAVARNIQARGPSEWTYANAQLVRDLQHGSYHEKDENAERQRDKLVKVLKTQSMCDKAADAINLLKNAPTIHEWQRLRNQLTNEWTRKMLDAEFLLENDTISMETLDNKCQKIKNTLDADSAQKYGHLRVQLYNLQNSSEQLKNACLQHKLNSDTYTALLELLKSKPAVFKDTGSFNSAIKEETAKLSRNDVVHEAYARACDALEHIQRRLNSVVTKLKSNGSSEQARREQLINERAVLVEGYKKLWMANLQGRKADPILGEHSTRVYRLLKVLGSCPQAFLYDKNASQTIQEIVTHYESIQNDLLPILQQICTALQQGDNQLLAQAETEKQRVLEAWQKHVAKNAIIANAGISVNLVDLMRKELEEEFGVIYQPIVRALPSRSNTPSINGHISPASTTRGPSASPNTQQSLPSSAVTSPVTFKSETPPATSRSTVTSPANEAKQSSSRSSTPSDVIIGINQLGEKVFATNKPQFVNKILASAGHKPVQTKKQ